MESAWIFPLLGGIFKGEILTKAAGKGREGRKEEEAEREGGREEAKTEQDEGRGAPGGFSSGEKTGNSVRKRHRRTAGGAGATRARARSGFCKPSAARQGHGTEPRMSVPHKGEDSLDFHTENPRHAGFVHPPPRPPSPGVGWGMNF